MQVLARSQSIAPYFITTSRNETRFLLAGFRDHQTRPHDRLRELRRERKWSQEKLAGAADMHLTYLAGIEHRVTEP
jgi:DNA-binding XRE family transcriptional regulator